MSIFSNAGKNQSSDNYLWTIKHIKILMIASKRTLKNLFQTGKQFVFVQFGIIFNVKKPLHFTIFVMLSIIRHHSEITINDEINHRIGNFLSFPMVYLVSSCLLSFFLYRAKCKGRCQFSADMAAKMTHLHYENILDLFIECFGPNKSCQKWYFKQLISRW